jgi:hypothetical protein
LHSFSSLSCSFFSVGRQTDCLIDSGWKAIRQSLTSGFHHLKEEKRKREKKEMQLQIYSLCHFLFVVSLSISSTGTYIFLARVNNLSHSMYHPKRDVSTPRTKEPKQQQ